MIIPKRRRIIVLADAQKAQLYLSQVSNKEKSSSLRFLEKINFDDVFDQDPRPDPHQGYEATLGHTSHFNDPHKAPKDIDRDDFARYVMNRLMAYTFDGLILIAEPKMLHRFRDYLHQSRGGLGDKIEGTLDKNFAHATLAEIQRTLKKYFIQ